MKNSLQRFIKLKNQYWGNPQVAIPKNWQQHLISLYIVRKDDGICLFSHHFQLSMISQIETQLVGMGFTALAKMMREIIDSSARLCMIDLGERKVLIDERSTSLTVLVTTENSLFLRGKLEELTDYFEKIFELQKRINLTTRVCLEDYALTADLVSLVFKDKPTRVLEIVPLIFKSIRKTNSIFSEPNAKEKEERFIIRKRES